MRTFDPFCQVRFGGLPYASANMPAPGISEAVDELIQAESELFAHRDSISDALHEVIGGIGGGQRRHLIELRRQLFNAHYEAALATLSNLAEPVRVKVEGLLGGAARALRSYSDNAARIAGTYSENLAIERSILAGFARDAQFMAGLAVSAPSLIPAINRFASNVTSGRVDKKDRKTERSLQSYVLRASTKTSPFSRLGPLALAPRDESVPPVAHRTSGSRFSVYPVARSLNSLAMNPERLGNLRVRVSPFIHDEDGTLSVDRTRWTFKDIDSRDDYASSVESRVTISQRPLTDAVCEILDGGEETFCGLTDRLVRSSGLAQEEVVDLLGGLMRLGYLEIADLTLHPHQDCHLSEMVSALDDGGTGSRLAALVRTYEERAESFAEVSDPRERLRRLDALRLLMERMYAEAGVNGVLPRSVVYEDVLVPAAEVEYSDPSRQLRDRDLTAVVRLLDLLDDANVKHALMRGYFENQHRMCIPAAEFIDGFIADLYESFEGYDLGRISDDALAEDPWLRWGGAWQWVRARRDFVARLQGRCTTAPLGTRAAAHLTEWDAAVAEDLESAVTGLAKESPAFRHVNILVQRVPGGDDVVLNDAFGGIGFQISRFTHLLHTDTAVFTAEIEAIAHARGVRLAELSGGAVFTNLNLHDPLLSTQLSLPGEPTGSRSAASIDLADLSVEYSAAQGRLVLSDGQEWIHPVYSGYLVPAATPRRSQVVSLFGPSATISHKLTELVSPRPERGSMAMCPRMRLGNVVISRARLIIHCADFPAANPLTAPGYTEWVKFWSSNALPERCFVRVLKESEGQTKPNYFDVRLVVSCSTLHNLLRDPGAESYVEIAEPLPAGATGAAFGADVISELMVGISLTEDNQ